MTEKEGAKKLIEEIMKSNWWNKLDDNNLIKLFEDVFGEYEK